jgi:hypothetical protein
VPFFLISYRALSVFFLVLHSISCTGTQVIPKNNIGLGGGTFLCMLRNVLRFDQREKDLARKEWNKIRKVQAGADAIAEDKARRKAATAAALAASQPDGVPPPPPPPSGLTGTLSSVWNKGTS